MSRESRKTRKAPRTRRSLSQVYGALRSARRTLGPEEGARLEAGRPGRAGLVEALAEGAGESRRGVRPRRAAGAEELGDLGDPLRLDEPVHEGAGHRVGRIGVERVETRYERALLHTRRRLARHAVRVLALP